MQNHWFKSMKTIKEIKKITIELHPEGKYIMYFNDIKEDAQVEIPEDNLRQAARSATRVAEQIWDMWDHAEVVQKRKE